MAILQIPTRNDLDAYSFVIELEKRNYLLRFRFNERMNTWFMDICKTDGTPILAGLPLLTDTDLVSRFVIPDLPPGLFVAVDESGQGMDAGRFDLGASVKLLYRESTG